MDLTININKDVFLPVYQPLLDVDDDIMFFWGGRDSGKSVFIAERLILKCLMQPYFRCILIRSTLTTVKDSQFQTIKDIINDWGLSKYFKFTESPLKIKCLLNGNTFIARGCDDIQKIKSVRDPSDAWYEEGNQISEDEFITIMTSLRTDKAKVQQWFSFNPECEGDYNEFWLYTNWTGEHTGIVRNSKQMTVQNKVLELKYTSCHTTYHDNKYCSDVRKAIHEYLGQTSDYYYQVYTRGMWGNRVVSDAFAHQFNKAKHVNNEIKHNPDMRLRISIDFNISPFAITFYHMWIDKDGLHYHVFDEMSVPNASIPKVVEYIKSKYAPWLPSCQLTGDNMGNQRQISQRDHASLYRQIRTGLNLSHNQLNLKANPTHENSRADVNYLLIHADFQINEKQCPETTRDMQFVECTPDGKIKKANRKQANQKADHIDTVRYGINTDCKDWINRHMRTFGYRKTNAPLTDEEIKRIKKGLPGN